MFLFSTVAFVPNRLRGEFINVAVIVGSDSTGERAILAAAADSPAMARATLLDDTLVSEVDRFVTATADMLAALPAENPEYPRGAATLEEWLEAASRLTRGVIAISRPLRVALPDFDTASRFVFEQSVAG